jgi:hypothetical protein
MVQKNHIGRNNTLSYSRVWTPWSRVLLEKLTVSHPIKKCPLSYGTRRVTRARYILFTHSICLRYTLIISFCVQLEPVHLRVVTGRPGKRIEFLHSARTQPPVQWAPEDLSGEGVKFPFSAKVKNMEPCLQCPIQLHTGVSSYEA